MRPPFIVYELGDLELFQDVASMERYLEPIDIENNEYTVYDSEGRLVQLTIESVPTTSLFGLVKGHNDSVRVAGCEIEPLHSAELATRIRDYLARTGQPVAADQPLQELVETLHQVAGFVV